MAAMQVQLDEAETRNGELQGKVDSAEKWMEAIKAMEGLALEPVCLLAPMRLCNMVASLEAMQSVLSTKEDTKN